MHSFLIKAALATSIALLLPTTLPTASATPATEGKQAVVTDIFDLPVITSVRGRVVTVHVPAGYESVTLERRTGKWKPAVPLATQAADGNAQELTFRLRSPVPRRLLQASGIRLPTVMAGGRLTEFLAEPLTNLPVSQTITLDLGAGTTFNSSSASGTLSGATMTLANNGLSTSAASNVSPSREVLESDIWKKKGDRLYFFNQYRGLQVIDVQNPADPALVGEVYLPASGMNLYPLGDDHVVLLTSKSSNFTWNQEPIQVGQGEVLICDVSVHQPKIVARLPYEGSLVESRLVGSSLYLATKGYQSAFSSHVVSVSGFDLRIPAQPVARNTVALPPTFSYGYYPSDVVQANDRYFLVGRDSYALNSPSLFQQSQVSLVDITAPDASVVKRGTATVEGIVDDKFKIQEHNGVLTTIAWNFRQKNGSNRWVTELTNFDVSNPDAPRRLASLDLGIGERLHGTRFDGDRVYVVTFQQIDPLWIVDNSNPAAPEITGHVEVPGFSTYLEPLGDRLVTIGSVNGRPTASLFDVSIPSAPKTLSQITLTQDYGSTEALTNEKAFTVLPEEGLVMVPLSDYYYTFNSAHTLQLLDLERNALKLRGKITQAGGIRRSTVHRGNVLSLGNSSLLTADISNRDQPVVLADLDLTSRVDRVWRQGDYLLQIGGAINDCDQTISVSRADAPGEILSTHELPNEYVVMAHLHDGYLYVLQNVHETVSESSFLATVRSRMELRVFNVASLPQIVRESTVSLDDNFPVNLWTAKFLFPKPGTMVLATLTNNNGGCIAPYPILRTLPIDNISFPIDWAGGGMQLLSPTDQSGGGFTLATTTSSFIPISSGLIAINFGPPHRDLVTFDISQPKAVKLLGTKRIQPPQASNMSEAFAASGKIYFTHYNGWYRTLFLATADAAKDGVVPDAPNPHVMGRHYLDVVDFTDAANPVVRPPVSAPGTLAGLNPSGAVFYSFGPGYQPNGKTIGNSWGLHAAAYTGEKMALIDTFEVKDRAATAALAGDRIFVLGRLWEGPNSGKVMAQLVEFDGSKLSLLDAAPFPSLSARALDHYLLGMSYSGYGYSALAALDFSKPRDLRFLGYHAVASYALDLQNLVSDSQNGFFFAAGIYGLMHVPQPE